MPVIERDPRCGWCVYNESDGHCTCKRRCSNCGTEYVGLGNHTQDDCIKVLKEKLNQGRAVRSCNRHSNCDQAVAKFEAENGRKPGVSFHCHDDECEDCFGC